MAGTIIGGRKASKTNRQKYGQDFYKVQGSKGGSKVHPETRPFFANRELARIAGARGGRISRRGPNKPKEQSKASVRRTVSRFSKILDGLSNK